jgi:hypothetical protein
MKTNNNINEQPTKTKQQLSSTLKIMLYEQIKYNILESFENHSFHADTTDIKNTKTIDTSILDVFLYIDNFVEKILFPSKSKSNRTKQDWIYTEFEQIGEFNSEEELMAILPNYIPSPKIQLFYSCRKRIEQATLITHPPRTRKENISLLVALIKNSEETKLYKKDLTYRISQARKNQKSITSYIDNIFYTHKKLSVIRFDLAYNYTDNHSINSETAFLHKKNFLNNIRKHSIFNNDCVGYIANIEYNIYKGGYYFHYFFFFLEKAILPYTNLITDIWESRITHGSGKCTPYHPIVRHQNSLGTGLISQLDQKSRNRLQLAIEFIIYKNIHFNIIKDNPNSKKKFRTLFRGEEKPEKLFR